MADISEDALCAALRDANKQVVAARTKLLHLLAEIIIVRDRDWLATIESPPGTTIEDVAVARKRSLEVKANYSKGIEAAKSAFLDTNNPRSEQNWVVFLAEATELAKASHFHLISWDNAYPT